MQGHWEGNPIKILHFSNINIDISININENNKNNYSIRNSSIV